MAFQRLLLPGVIAILLTASIAAAEPEPLEFRVPVFDHNGIEASYVVSLPADYDPAKKYPLILDFHGAISPTRKGANITRKAVWASFATEAGCIVAGLNSRTRAWDMVKGNTDDRFYAVFVLGQVRKRYSIDPKRVYLAGFSSGSDFLCKGRLQVIGKFAGSLVVCGGPANVLGLRGGELLEAGVVPFLFATGEEDYVRKSGSWEAHLALGKAGHRSIYVEVPGKGHEFFGVDTYVRLFERLEQLAGNREGDPEVAPAPQAEGEEEALRAGTVDELKEPGRAYEAWWRVLTRFHHVPRLRDQAAGQLARIEAKVPRRELYQARRDFFRRRGDPPGEGGRLWGFDRFLGYREITAALKDLARRFPDRARLRSMGKSVEGRDLWVLSITDPVSGPPEDKPAVYLQGAIHGNEACSAMTVLYTAWQLAANPEKSRGTDRALRGVTVYAAPAVNPDAVHHFVSEPHSSWRPRFNYRPEDDDGDGRKDEDPYEDLDGDGEIGLMYAPDPEGPFVLKDGRMVRRAEGKKYRLVGREGIDNDGDGKYSEDRPGGVDLNRNFPVGFKSRRRLGGTSGPAAASEPETKAVMGFVKAHPNIALFLDVHANGNCMFFWLGPDENPDAPLLHGIAERAEKALAYPPKPLKHTGAGLAIAWAYGEMGIPALLVELESVRGSKEDYRRSVWQGDAFQVPKPFAHPKLGEILLGSNLRKLARHNPHPSDIFWQADRVYAWVKAELGHLPKLEIQDPFIKPVEGGFVVSMTIANAGDAPMDTARSRARGEAPPMRITCGELEKAALPGPGAGDAARDIHVRVEEAEAAAGLRIHHPRAGTVKLPITRPRAPTRPIRRKYAVEAGYATADSARATSIGAECGPAFEVKNRKAELRVAVLMGEWEERPHRIPADEFRKAFFGPYRDRSATGQPVYGSVRDFYLEMSYGRFDVRGRVFDWVTLPGEYAEYRDASFGSQVLHQRIEAAVRARDGEDALEGFDCLAFVWAGNAIRRTSMLWPMRLTLRERPELVAFKMSELFHGESAPIGVACHELAHTFGVNDKYGLGASKNPLGPWCLIGKGTHGAEPSRRHRPFHLCAWCKSVLGWIEPVVIDPATPQRLALRPVLGPTGDAFRVLLAPDGSEYLLLTNRRREGFFTDLPSPGLVVLKVGPNDKPSAPQARVELLPAHGRPPAGRSDPADPARIAWPQPGRDELTVGGVRISNIRLVDDVIHFEVGPSK